GFIDLQLNGCGGVLFNTQTSEKTLDVMNRTNLLSGTTQFLPTFITSQHDSMCRAIDVVAGLENKSALGVLGLHLEGPFISKEKKGAHNENHIRTLDELTALYLADHKDQISVVTLAPEHTPQSVIDILHQAGIRVSLGHTNASY
ncbi:amidohydrolase family protein, partial [Vibrio natriegens]